MNRKITVPLADGLLVEAVYYPSGTLCLSSQAGCAVGCPFCASGSRGLRRNLTAAEMLLQLETARASGCEPQRLTLSGIGEPLHNFPVISDLIINGRFGLPVSLTTSGGPLEHLQILLSLPHNGVMISLHAGSEATRRHLVPRAPALVALRTMLQESWVDLPVRVRRKLGLNYLLFDGINDNDEELSALLEWLQPFPQATLHLLEPSEGGATGYRPSSRRDRWFSALRVNHPQVRRGNRWRTSAEGGCGTLYVRRLDELQQANDQGGA